MFKLKLLKPVGVRNLCIRSFQANKQNLQVTSTSINASHATSWKRIFFRTSLAVIGGGVVYDGFNEFEHIGGATRFLRSLKIAAQISFDYSWNLYGITNESKEYDKIIKEINLRCANRILNGCLANGGLYIKIGQGVSAINHILPHEYTNTLKQLEDKCLPRKPDEVKIMFQEEFGKSPDDLFAEFNYDAIAAASLAQVFKARTIDGNDVAVKVQYRDLIKRFSGDFNTILFLQNIIKIIHKNYNFGWILIDLRKNLEQELDFINEGKNSERCARDLNKFDYVHVPIVEWALTTKRILTAEWIDGYKISDLNRIKADKFSLKDIDKKLFNTFSEQIFNTGFVHADPHPGNVFIRKNKKSGKPEIVLLDHGLYEYLPKDIRLSLCKFWEAIVLKDQRKMDKYAKELNVDDSLQLAEVLLQRPVDMSGRKLFTTRLTEEDIAYIQEKAKKRFDIVLTTLKQIPRNMLFIVRNLNTIRAIARTHGDPLDRPTYMAKYAQQCIAYSEHLGIFKYLPWLLRRIRFEYNLLKMVAYFWFIRAYLNVLTLVGRSLEGSSNILNYSPDTD